MFTLQTSQTRSCTCRFNLRSKGNRLQNKSLWINTHHENKNLLSTRKKKHRIPVEAIMSPGTMKDNPHAEDTKAPAMREPKMFPTEV